MINKIKILFLHKFIKINGLIKRLSLNDEKCSDNFGRSVDRIFVNCAHVGRSGGKSRREREQNVEL